MGTGKGRFATPGLPMESGSVVLPGKAQDQEQSSLQEALPLRDRSGAQGISGGPLKCWCPMTV